MMEMVLAAGVKVILHAMVVRVKKEGNTVRSLVVETKGGQLEAEGEVFIDSTGDGDVAASAGSAFAKGNSEGKLQPPTLIFRMGGVDYEKARRFRPQFPQFVKEATVNGDLDLKREDLLVFQGTPARGRCLSIARVFMMWMGPIPSTLPGLRLRLEGKTGKSPRSCGNTFRVLRMRTCKTVHPWYL